MKRRWMNLIRCLLVVCLLLFGTIPCHAMVPINPQMISSMEELLAWYAGLSGTAPQECGVTQPVVCKGEIYLEETTCRADITLLGGLRVPSGAWLTLDNPNLVVMGPSSAITVEPGGVLCVKRLHPLVAQAMPQGGIVVQAGGMLLLQNESMFAHGVVVDHNAPPNTILPPDTTPPATTPSPETPPVEEKLTLKGEVLKVSAQGSLLAILTLPRVDPALTKNIAVERSTDLEAWETKYNFRWNEEGKDFRSEDDGEFGSMCGRNRSDGSKTDFKYLARLSGEPFYLRVILTGTDGQQTVSNAIRLAEPSAGNHPGSEDYEFHDGNRGGGGQGVTDREDQKQPEVSGSDNALTAEPQLPTKASPGKEKAEVSLAPTPAPQGYALTAQANAPVAQNTAAQHSAMGAEETVRPAQASLSGQPEQSSSEKPKSPNSSVRNTLVIAATLALCGAMWIVTIKRKKS